ncbi:hypothetical protein KAU33_04640 [Candidatus Dependentiae bacterium]|nr:hypothetical protein [Candidatus Dependentiae bacterium]
MIKNNSVKANAIKRAEREKDRKWKSEKKKDERERERERNREEKRKNTKINKNKILKKEEKTKKANCIFERFFDTLPEGEFRKFKFICKMCGTKFVHKVSAVEHYFKKHEGELPPKKMKKPSEKKKKKRREKLQKKKKEKELIKIKKMEKVELMKPWEDPESLFCDAEFLEKPVEEGGFGVSVEKGDKC